MKRYCCWLPLAFFLCCFLKASYAEAGDPLDDVSGTEEWDQVVPPAKPTVSETIPRDDFRHQVEDWNAIRIQWQDERESFFQERTRLGRVAPLRTPAVAPASPAARSTPRTPPAEEDWGDRPGSSWSAPSAIDRVIDEELGEAKPSPSPNTPAPVSAVPAPALPASEPEAETLSSFRGAGDKKSAAPEEVKPASPAPALPPPETEFPPLEPPPSRKNVDDEAAGAAAAAALLKQLEEERRKEQEALRKKAQLEEDEEGQIVDPELKKEMSEEQEP